MSDDLRVSTVRLLLRRWQDADLAPFAALNADPDVMQHMTRMLDRDESEAFAQRIDAGFDAHGFGLWAVQVRSTGEFVGFTGLARQDFEAPFTPCVEVGWRLARAAWGHGYATEAAQAALTHGFEMVGLTEIVSMTRRVNTRSQAVMRRLGMRTDAGEDFHYPGAPGSSAEPESVLYRLGRDQWRARKRQALA